MIYSAFISTEDLSAHLSDPDWVIVDCRFDLSNPSWGESIYQQGHIPGAVFADLEKDLSSPVLPESGRHPLPDLTQLMERFGRWGISSDTQVVAYDSASGSYAARLWCLLRFFGHEKVAVLDGDLRKWLKENRPVNPGEESNTPRNFSGKFSDDRVMTSSQLQKVVSEASPYRLIDARSPERFRGEVEPIDRIPGRIPGAVNRFHADNLQPDGTIKPPNQLREEFSSLLAGVDPQEAIVYCGSGVTSCLHLVAMEAAGLPGAKIYLGSYSEWIRDPNRAIEKG